MILEYLVKGEKNADICISIIEQTSATPKKKQLKADTYIVTAYLKNDSDSSAITLSKIHEDIVAAVDCIVLTDESSAYYDRVLFPRINQFERKLRKLLYSASVISADQDNHIVDLESKDFGELFTMLFRDEDYWKIVKTFVNGHKKGQQIQQEQGCVSGPKKLGSFGASFLYPIFLRIGFITKKQTVAAET